MKWLIPPLFAIVVLASGCKKPTDDPEAVKKAITQLNSLQAETKQIDDPYKT